MWPGGRDQLGHGPYRYGIQLDLVQRIDEIQELALYLRLIMVRAVDIA
jgi:hypothetical protein